jgi:predicted RNA-binding Zn ribbon-like protein
MTTPAPSHPTLDLAAGHTHPVDLDATLDLVNTVVLDDGVPRETLPSAEDAMAFFRARSIAHEAALREQADADPEAWLARVRGARAALREVWDAAVEGRSVAPDAVATLNAELEHGPHPELRAGLAGVVVGHRHADDATGEALARLVEPLVAAIEAGETDRFRVCANDGCRWVFEDTSRGGRRRWCDMRSCGNRAKVRRYRSRHRDVAASGDG